MVIDMRKILFTLLLLTSWLTVASAQTSTLGRSYSLKNFGCAGDGVTNDTVCVAAAFAAVTTNGGELVVPTGTYLTDPITTTANSIIIRGLGWGSIIKSRTNGALITFDNSATYTHSITIRDMAFEGFGSGAGNNGVVVSGSNEKFNWKMSNVKLSAFGGTPYLVTGGAIFTSSWEDMDISQPSGATGHAFDVIGAQTNSIKRTYVHNVATGYAAYRLRQGSWFLESVNGIDSGTSANWGIYGQQVSADGTDTYAQITHQTCNIEDWSATDGEIYRIGSFGSYYNTKFDTLATGTYRAIILNFVDTNTVGIFDAESGFLLNGTATWTNSLPVHSFGVPFVPIGSNEIASYYDTTLVAAVSTSNIGVALNGASSRSTIDIKRLSLGTGSGEGMDGHFLFATNNAYNVGNSGFTASPANVFVGTKLQMATGATTVEGQNWVITGGTNPSLSLNDGSVNSIVQLSAGTGQRIGTVSAHPLQFLTNNTATWEFTSGGDLRVLTGSRDIGQAAGNRPANVRATTALAAGVPGVSKGSLIFGNVNNSSTQTIEGADTPVSTNRFLWPSADPTVGQVLSASAPSAGVVTLSWAASAGSGTVTGTGTATRVAFWSSASAITSDSTLYWDNTDKRLGIGTSSPGLPLDVVADATALAQQWRENGAGTARVQMQIPSSFGQFGTSSNHSFALMTNGTQHLNVEATGAVVVGSISVATATLQSNAIGTGDIALIANNAGSTTVDLARFQIAGSNRFRFLNTGEAVLGLASTAAGKLTFANSANGNTFTFQPGTTASNLTFTLPTTDSTGTQCLSSNGSGVLGWSACSGGSGTPGGSDTQLQYNNAGSFGGISTLTTNGTIVTFAPTVTTGTGATSGLNANANNLTTGDAFNFGSSSATSGNLIKAAITGTAATTNNTVLNISNSGATSTNAQTTYGAIIGNTRTNATSGTNVALQLTASGATTANTALNVTAGTIVQASNSATAFESGPNGGTNPVFRLVNSTASQATGITITGTAAAAVGGPIIAAISSGSNEDITIAVKGTGRFYVPATHINSGGSVSFVRPGDFLKILQIGSDLNLYGGNIVATSSGGLFFTDNTAIAAGSQNLGIIRAAGGVARVTNASTGSGALLIAPSSATVTGNFTVLPDNAATAAVVDIARLGVNSTGTAAAGFGGQQSFTIESSTTNDQLAGLDKWYWLTATHASRGSVVSRGNVSNAITIERDILTPRKTLTDATATNIVNITLPTLTGASGFVDYEAYASDGTDVQVRRGTLAFSVVNKAGSYTSESSIVNEAGSLSTGTFTCTFDFSNGSNQTTLRANCDSSLTPTTLYIIYHLRNQSEQAMTIQ